MGQEILRASNITKTYGDKVILNNISFDVIEGEILGVIGSSGSGKTTLLHSIIGFLRPDGGDVKFRQRHLVAGSEDAEEVYGSIYKKKNDFKHIFGFAAQVPSFYEKLTVVENLKYFGDLYGLSKESLNANINTLLSMVNLENSANQLGKNLSGGMERRLDIACSLIHNPSILLLDEPTADLDPILRNNIWNLIQKINNKGTTVILSSHHLNELETLCNRIAIIMNGKLLDLGTPDELKEKYLKNHDIIIQTYPANYEELTKKIKAKLDKKLSNIRIEGNELVVSVEKPQEVLNDMIKIIEREKEKILELKLIKPNLDQMFISINQKK
ncbi:MAG: ABC transporter ATP-binding protein [Candidatus Woesearchaeota archaeon]